MPPHLTVTQRKRCSQRNYLASRNLVFAPAEKALMVIAVIHDAFGRRFCPLENQELAEINASLQAIVRRAYDLGRTEALKRVVDVLSADRPASDQLALMAPDKMPQPHVINGQEEAPKPWWAWPVR